MLTGGCLCGAVRFGVRGDLGTIVHCHCTDCRKAQGGAFATNAPVAAEAFVITSGAGFVSRFESSPGKFRCFCSRCGSPVYSFRDSMPGAVRIRLGTLDADPGGRPVLHSWVGEKAPWLEITDELPRFRTGDAASLVDDTRDAGSPVDDAPDTAPAPHRAVANVLINIDVDDLEPAIRFYARALGLRPARRLFDGTVAEMLGGPSPIYLLRKPAGTAPSATVATVPRSYRRHWTPVHLDFAVDDIDAAVERARAAGATLEGEVQSYEWGRLAPMSDPFGHGFCLIQLAGGGYQ
jgi:predicted enzyme related to lactoylglutathione lyase